MKFTVHKTLNAQTRHLERTDPVPIEGDISIPVDRYVSQPDALRWREGKTGVRIERLEDVTRLNGSLTTVPLIVIDEKAVDAEALAREIVSTHGFTGRIQAGR